MVRTPYTKEGQQKMNKLINKGYEIIDQIKETKEENPYY